MAGQEIRAMDTFDRYFVDFYHDDKPMPWLKVAGEALIAWVRENKPEVLIKGANHD